MKKIKLFFLLLTCAVGLNAQDIPSAEDAAKKKEINQIKLSEEAVYADVMQPAATPEEAIEQSKARTFTLLQTHVVEAVVKDLNMSREDAKKLWSELESKCHHIVVSQMDMYRVFTYIMRADLMPGAATAQPAETAVATEVAPVVGVAVAQPVQAAPVVAAQPADSALVAQAQPVEAVVPVAQPADSTAVAVVPVAQPIDSVAAAPTAQPVQPVQAAPVVAAQPVQAVQPVDSAMVPQAQPVQTVAPVAQPADSAAVAVVAQPVQAVQAAPVQAAPVVAAQPVQAAQPVVEPEPEPEPEIVVEIPALCQTMIDKGNMSDLMRFLNTEKNYQRLMYGNSSTMQYPEKCYIVIIDKETREIVSVLDKGQRERMNFITKEMDRYSNYRRGNYAAVFVQEY